jgi:hypothetical protein
VPTNAVLPSAPDISSVITSFGVLSLAIAAVIGGLYKGFKEVKKDVFNSGTHSESVTVGRNDLTGLTESNVRLIESHKGIIEVLLHMDRSLDKLVEAILDGREMTRSQIEEQHRLRAATVDLVDQMRRANR